MERFIGLDVHRPSTTCAVIDARGKRVRVDVLETNGQALIEFLKLQPGTLRLCMEEGTQALWLAEILTPHVEQLAVVHVSRVAWPEGRRAGCARARRADADGRSWRRRSTSTSGPSVRCGTWSRRTR